MFQVASEHFYFWLIALKFFCEAESLLSISCDSQLALDKQISDACSKYHKGITTLKVKKCLHMSHVGPLGRHLVYPKCNRSRFIILELLQMKGIVRRVLLVSLVRLECQLK